MNKILCILMLFISIFQNTFSQSFIVYGDKCFGGVFADFGFSILKTSGDNLILVGLSGNDISGNKSQIRCNPSLIYNSDIWMLQIDPTFNIIWQKNIGGNFNERFPVLNFNLANSKFLFSCESNSDSGCNKSEGNRAGIGSSTSDYWFGLLNTSGNIIWEKTLGGMSTDHVPEFIQLTSGDFIISGVSTSGIGADKTVPNFGTNDYWVIKLDSLGNKIWDKAYGGIGNNGYFGETQKVLIPSSNGSFVIGGTTDSPVSGSVSIPSKGLSDFWIIKIDSAGNKVWDKRYGGIDHEICHTIINTSDNGFLAGGETDSPQSGDVSEPTRGNKDYWVIKLDSLGNKQWDKRFGGNGYDRLFALEKTLDNGFLLAGGIQSNLGYDISGMPYGTEDYWVVKIDSIGNKIWDKRFGVTSGSSFPASITELSDSSIVVFGVADSGTSSVKTDPGYGSSDYWAVRFKYFPSSVGIEEMNLFNQSVSVFPNPAKDFIKINSQNVPIKKIELVNLLGEILFSQTIENTQTIQLNLQPYQPGFYFVKVSSEKYTVTKRLVKE